MAARGTRWLAWRACRGINLRRVEESENDLAGHPDRARWNARYGTGFTPSFTAASGGGRQRWPWTLPAARSPTWPAAPSGSALLAAAQGRPVTAVNVSEVALGLLAQEARRRGLDQLITLVHADLHAWRPAPGRYALMLATGFWDPAVFAAAVPGLAPGGVLGWEAFTAGRPPCPPDAARTLVPGSRLAPATLLPDGITVISQEDLLDTSGAPAGGCSPAGPGWGGDASDMSHDTRQD